MSTMNEKVPPGSAQPAPVAPETEPIPDWLLEFARKPNPVVRPTQAISPQQVSLPNPVFSDQERSIVSQINTPVEPETAGKPIEAEPVFIPKSIWEEEDAVELGLPIPNQTLIDPVDELKILLDDDPQETVAFIRAHMHDADFRAAAINILHAYLALEPNNGLLWQIYEELKISGYHQEA